MIEVWNQGHAHHVFKRTKKISKGKGYPHISYTILAIYYKRRNDIMFNSGKEDDYWRNTNGEAEENIP